MRSNSVAEGGNGGSVWLTTQLGFYWSPGNVANGYLSLSADIAYNFTWICDGSFSTAYAWSWYGFLVTEFDLNGQSFATPVNQQINLWDDNSTNTSDGNQGAVTGINLTAALPVDNDHYYNIWVQMMTHAQNNGDGPFSHSAAQSYLNMLVSSISYTLT
jgi:hypothetical protein